jgi:acetyl-CoA carboxylase carboxyl transferase subunit alpha
LWRSRDKAMDAAQAQKLTAQDLLQLGVIDKIIPEPIGGAHRHKSHIVRHVGEAIVEALESLCAIDGKRVRENRREKFIAMGQKGL